MADGGGNRRQHGGKMQRSPTRAIRETVAIGHGGHQSQQFIHIRRFDTHIALFK
jgi:hypothetical protein